MIKTVLFDADGVLINGGLFSVQLKRDFGLTIPNDFFENEFQPALIGKSDLKEILADKVKEWGWKKSVDDLLDYWFKAEHQIDQELIKIVKKLKAKGIMCVVVTNQEKYRAKYITEQMGFGELFDGVFASGNIGFKKPQEQFFQYVLDHVKCNGDETIYFDDSPGYLDGAKSLGIHAYLYTGIKQLKSEFKKHHLL
jgi:putative hydrolase of the HAD superfamily